MANVIICDRCGIILKRFTTGLVNIDITREAKSLIFSSYTSKENLHLCDSCYDAFGDFLRNDKKEEVVAESEEAREE